MADDGAKKEVDRSTVYGRIPVGFTPRRIVTGHNETGDSVVVSDSIGPARNADGPGMLDFWQETNASVVDSRHTSDAVAGPQVLAPPAGGHKFRFFTIPPAPKSLNLMSEAEKNEYWSATQRAFAGFGAAHEWTGTRVPGMHVTQTIDYIIVLQGEVTLVLDKSETRLGPFDVVVQRGTNHGWWVAPDQPPCTMVAVLIDCGVVGGKGADALVAAKGGSYYGDRVPSKL